MSQDGVYDASVTEVYWVTPVTSVSLFILLLTVDWVYMKA